jgi:hypothetical protein
MSTLYSIALKLSLEGVNQLKEQFSVVTQEIKKTSAGFTNVLKNSKNQLSELTKTTIVQALGIGAVIAGITKSIRTQE